jgi:endonuclease/exonuclease/phosphatase family metal-dependent hydrolase
MMRFVVRGILFGSLFSLAAGASSLTSAQSTTSLRVMSYNIWLGGANAGPLSRTVGVIQTAQADIIGIQERGSNGQAIATALGYHYQSLGSSTAILSRFPIVETLAYGVKVQMSPLQEAYVFDVHLAPYPYQPYDIRDGLITTEAQAIASAQATRGGATTALLNNMSTSLSTGIPVFLTGDFNEPSHLDWTAEAAAAGKHFGMQVDWPTSSSVVSAGLSDAFRTLRPDEIADPGFTWTPGYPAPTVTPDEVQDRIDFVYYAGHGVVPTLAQTLGYNANDGSTDIALQPYPSDHRAVVVEFDVPGCFVQGDINGDCTLNVNDWTRFRSGQHLDMAGLTPSQAYALGDINGDFRNDHADFALFKAAFEATNGAGSFAEMLVAVPEPGCFAMLCAVICVCYSARLRICRASVEIV